MSTPNAQTSKTSSELDQEYHDTVLKVPDCFGVAKGAVTLQMEKAGRDLFNVSNKMFFFAD